MESTCTASSPVDVPARLSSAQKRDLLGQAVAAAITTALVAAPFVTSLTALPSQSFAGPVAAVPIVDTPTPLLALVATIGFVDTPRRLTPPISAIAFADTPMPVTPPVAAVSRATQATATSGREGLASDVPARPARKSLSRRVSGWLTGDGTHTVRPFPIVASSQP